MVEARSLSNRFERSGSWGYVLSSEGLGEVVAKFGVFVTFVFLVLVFRPGGTL